jgi:hypothetical protein
VLADQRVEPGLCRRDPLRREPVAALEQLGAQQLRLVEGGDDRAVPQRTEVSEPTIIRRLNSSRIMPTTSGVDPNATVRPLTV